MPRGTQHLDPLAALKRADDANAIARATAERQALDTATSLALSKHAVNAGENSARAVRENFIADRRPYTWLTDNLGEPQAIKSPNGNLQVAWTWTFTNYRREARSAETKEVHFISIDGEPFRPSYTIERKEQPGLPVPPNLTLSARWCPDQ